MLTKTDIEKYFIAEKQTSLLLMLIGVAAIVIVVVLVFFLKNNFWRGAAISLTVVGLMQIIIGYQNYSKSDVLRVDNVYAFTMNPQQLKEKELPRMILKKNKLVKFQWAEIVFILLGILLMLQGKFHLIGAIDTNLNKIIYGAGLMLALQLMILFICHIASINRANIFIAKLTAFVN